MPYPWRLRAKAVFPGGPDFARFPTLSYDLPAKAHDLRTKSHDFRAKPHDLTANSNDFRSWCLTHRYAPEIVPFRGDFGRFRARIVRFRQQIVPFRGHIVQFRPISCESEHSMKNRPPGAPTMALPISIDTYQQLLSASIVCGGNREIEEIGASAIREWITRNSPDSLKLRPVQGYQWKHLFLPDGTLLRTVFGGKNFHCRVEDDHLVFDGEKTSPSGFVTAVGGVRRNAWKALWILFPESSVWKAAHELRRKNNLKS